MVGSERFEPPAFRGPNCLLFCGAIQHSIDQPGVLMVGGNAAYAEVLAKCQEWYLVVYV